MSDNAKQDVTRFNLEIDLSRLTGEPGEEIARILRYWAAAMKHYDVGATHNEDLMDSSYQNVGSWELR